MCKHCRFGCTPDPAPVIDPDLALQVVSELRVQNRLQTVVLLGGEPGLFPALTLVLAKAIRALDLNVRVESNAFWAADDAAAERFLAPLYAEGASVMFSLDAFHAPFVPPQRVERAVRVSWRLGGESYVEAEYLDVVQ
jgi:pyruvate-formate lyase-activating enzyme